MKMAIFVPLALAAGLSSAFCQTARTLTMSGQGEERAVPDLATLSAGVTGEAPTAAAALSANTTHMQGIFAALKRLGVAYKDMQTSNFSVSPQMAGGNGQPPHITSYQVNNDVRVRLEDAARLGAALDALVTAGANRVNGVEFSILNPAPLLAAARADAVADAKARAETYARAAGVSLGPILSISENDNGGPRPVFMAAPMLRAARAVPAAAGEESITATVSIVWEIR